MLNEPGPSRAATLDDVMDAHEILRKWTRPDGNVERGDAQLVTINIIRVDNFHHLTQSVLSQRAVVS